MTTTQSGTTVHEIANGIYRISTPLPPSVMNPCLDPPLVLR